MVSFACAQDECLNGRSIEYPGAHSRSAVSAYAEIHKKADALAHFCMGTVYQKRDMLKEALQEYGKALALDPGSASILLRVGMIQMSQKAFAQAQKTLQQAVTLDPDLYLGHVLLATVYYAQEKIESAIEEYKRAIHSDPDKLSPYLSLG